MSLNNIVLSNSLLADLYPNVLVQGPATRKPVPFLGGNKKNILIIVNGKDTDYLPEGELAFLTTVLSACQLALSHVAIVNRASMKETSFAVLQGQFSPKKVLLLGVNPEDAGLSAGEQYALQPHGNFEAVWAPPLSEIEKTKPAKSRFWIALKELFCL